MAHEPRKGSIPESRWAVACLKLVLLLLAGGAIGGCYLGPPSMTNLVDRPTQLPHSIRAIAVAPSSGLVTDAIGIELLNRGYPVVDAQRTSSLLMRADLSEIEVLAPRNLTTLADQGIDAVLLARAAAGYDGLPESVSVRLTSTRTGQLLAGVVWQNARRGMAGSIADRAVRKGLTQAAREIVDTLQQALPPTRLERP